MKHAFYRKAGLLSALALLTACAQAETSDSAAHALFVAAGRDSGPFWTRSSADHLRLDGHINSETADEFIEKFDAKVRVVELNSRGGDVKAGLAIAERLAAADIDVVVDGYCLSSCANYLFVAGRHKEILRGIVGYHGSAGGCIKAKGGVENWLKESSPDLKDPKQIADFRILTQTLTERENRFFGQLGVDPELFARTCSDDKGKGDGKIYAVMLPSQKTFARYRITDVKGDSDSSFLSEIKVSAGETAGLIE